MAPEKKAPDAQEMNTIETAIGPLTYAEEDVLFMPEGLYGFEEFKKFIISEDADYTPFAWFVCTENPEILFPVIPVEAVVDNYSPKLPREVLEAPKLFVVTLGETMEEISVNLRAPIAVFREKGRAKQVILTDTQYPLDLKLLNTKVVRAN